MAIATAQSEVSAGDVPIGYFIYRDAVWQQVTAVRIVASTAHLYTAGTTDPLTRPAGEPVDVCSPL